MDEMREALEAAIDKDEENNPEETPNEIPKSEESEVTETGKPDDTGEQKEQEDKPSESKKPEESSDTEEQKPVEPSVPHETKAPQSWSPAEREEWGKLPANVQAQITKRENETAKALAETGQARQMAQTFTGMLGQYQSMFKAQGVDPVQGTNSILQTAAMLQGGSPMQKAEVVAGLIKNYGVDVKELDNMIVGKTSPANPEVEHLKTQLSELQGRFQQQDQAQQDALVANNRKMGSEVKQFVDTHEFAKDLSLVMADFMDMAEKVNQPINMETAYARALATRPDLQQIIAQRKNLASNQQNISRARQANVSLPQNGAVEKPGQRPTDMRGALEWAMENS